jgi:hypothetical protein
MRTRQWLKKEDSHWRQLVRWNSAREELFNGQCREYDLYYIAESCLLIEEARWFLEVLGRLYILDIVGLRSILRIAAKSDLHARTYLAMHERNNILLKECAELGDPMAQGQLPLRFDMSDHEEYNWWMKSMTGGYSTAFSLMIDRKQGDRNEQLECILKGIEAGSSTAMLAAAYSPLTFVDTPERIYWQGQNWLLPFGRSDDFMNTLISWHSLFIKDSYQITEGFVYGYIIDGLDKGEFKKLQRGDASTKGVRATLTAHQLYKTMCKNTRLAMETWCLVGKRLGVVKDIIRLIVKIVWRSRDQPQWYSNDLIP